MAEQYEAGFQT